ncbi:hypothetical protein D3C81_666270 [compost metagenome]
MDEQVFRDHLAHRHHLALQDGVTQGEVEQVVLEDLASYLLALTPDVDAIQFAHLGLELLASPADQQVLVFQHATVFERSQVVMASTTSVLHQLLLELGLRAFLTMAVLDVLTQYTAPQLTAVQLYTFQIAHVARFLDGEAAEAVLVSKHDPISANREVRVEVHYLAPAL